MRMALSDLRWPCLFGFALLAAVFPLALVAENLGFGGPEVLKLCLLYTSDAADE